MRYKVGLIFCLILSTSSFCQISPEMQKALGAVSPESIEATMSFLASDLVEGRQPGTRGFAIASQYVQSQFKSLGLKPGGEDGRYLQRVVLKKGVVDRSSSTF